MPQSMLKRSVRFNGKLYRAGVAEEEQALAEVLPPSSAERLVEKGYITEDFEAQGEEPEEDEDEVDERTLGQRRREKQLFMRDEGEARPSGVQIDAEGEPQDREALEPPMRDRAAREEADLDVEEEEQPQLRPSTFPVKPTLGSEKAKTGAKKGAKKTAKKQPNPFAKPEQP